MAPRTPLLHPSRFFTERSLHFGRVIIVFALVVFAGLATVYGVGYLLVSHVDGTVMVDNPERPPEMFCDSDMDSVVFDESDCDASRQVERNVDRLTELPSRLPRNSWSEHGRPSLRFEWLFSSTLLIYHFRIQHTILRGWVSGGVER